MTGFEARVDRHWLDGLLSVVGSAHVPPDLDKDRLASDIGSLIEYYAHISTFPGWQEEQDERSKTRLATLVEIAGTASHLAALLGKPPGPDFEDWFPRREGARYVSRSTRLGQRSSEAEDRLPSWTALKLGIDELASASVREAERMSAEPELHGKNATFQGLSVTDSAIAMAADVYERHFKRSPGVAHLAGGEVGGPFVRFCSTLFTNVSGTDGHSHLGLPLYKDGEKYAELKPIGRHSIGKALTNMRAARGPNLQLVPAADVGNT